MATTTTITSPTYAGEFAGKYISAALLSGSTIANGGIEVLPNVKYKQVIQKIATDGIVKNATCDFDATSTITLTERIITPEEFQVNLQLCKKDFHRNWEAITMGYSAFDNLPPSFADYLIAHVASKVAEKTDFVFYKDFAHSPSKLKATTNAIKHQYPSRKVVACMELHTFSSLKKEFLPHYKNAMEKADIAIVYYSPEVVEHKKLEPITKELVFDGFGGNVQVMNETSEVLAFIRTQNWTNSVLLMMSSGNFDGIDYDALGEELVQNLK